LIESSGKGDFYENIFPNLYNHKIYQTLSHPTERFLYGLFSNTIEKEEENEFKRKGSKSAGGTYR
jgi:hypothetical protein